MRWKDLVSNDGAGLSKEIAKKDKKKTVNSAKKIFIYNILAIYISILIIGFIIYSTELVTHAPPPHQITYFLPFYYLILIRQMMGGKLWKE